MAGATAVDAADRGIEATVSVNAVNGATTNQMTARLGQAIRQGTRLVILSIPLANDRRKKVNTSANVNAMKAELNPRG